MPSKSSSTPVVVLIGFPSSGKSTMINSLSGKRFLNTGVRRTTVEPTFIGGLNPEIPGINKIKKINLVCDDGHPYCIIDLPGVSDSEDKKNEFDEIADKYIEYADIILWVSSSQTAFLTNYEIEIFKKITEKVAIHSMKSNKVHQIGIVLSKMNEKVDEKKMNITNYIEGKQFDSSDSDSDTDSDSDSDSDSTNDESEISGDEDTTVLDCLVRIRKFFPDVNVDWFNAFGRITHKKKMSHKLKKLVKAKEMSSKYNINFSIDGFMRSFNAKADILNRKIFEKWYLDVNTNAKPNKRKFSFKRLIMSEGEGDTLKLFNSFMRMIYQADDFRACYAQIMGYDRVSDIKVDGDIYTRYRKHYLICRHLSDKIIPLVKELSMHKYGIYVDPRTLMIDNFLSDKSAKYVYAKKDYPLNKITIGQSIYRTTFIAHILKLTEPGSVRQMKYALVNYQKIADGLIYWENKYDLISNNIDIIVNKNDINCARVSILNVIKVMRSRLYGESDEADPAILIRLVQNKSLYSVFQPLIDVGEEDYTQFIKL